MAVFPNLVGNGLVALTSGTTHLFVQVTIFGPGYSIGVAYPPNYFKLGSLRIGFRGAYYHVEYIDATDMIIALPQAFDNFGYSLSPETAITVTEYVF